MPEPTPPTPPIEPPTTVELELPGAVKVTLPAAEAEKYKAARLKDKTEREEMARLLGASKAEREAAERKARQATEDAEAAKAAAAGEYAKVREIAGREKAEEAAKWKAKVLDTEAKALAADLRNAILEKVPGIDAQDLADSLALIRSRARINPETQEREYLDEAGQPLQVDGKPAGADALVSEFLSKRPKLVPVQIPGGGIPRGKPPVGGPVRIRYVSSADVAAGKASDPETLAGMKNGTVLIRD